ncbi:MAG: AAA family ATPase [Halobacteriota archaeon]
MKLESIRLQNIRAFEDSGAIPFKDGTISIYGENGSGKSTIVSSIGRAVFGWDIEAVKQPAIDYGGERHKQGATEYFLRKGANEGTIDVTFSHKGTAYRVINTISRKTQSWALYVDGEESDLFGKKEIHERIYNALDVRESHVSPIESTFSNLVCVLQGKIIGEFELASQKRKDHFDKVLGLYGYREAYNNSIHVKNNFKNKIARAESDARVLEAEIAHLDDQVKRLGEYEGDLTQIKRSIQAASSQLTEVEEEKQRYDVLLSEIDGFKRELNLVDSNAVQLGKMREEAVRDIQRARGAALAMEQSRPSFERYTHLSDQIDDLRTLLRNVVNKKEQLSDLKLDAERIASARKSKQDELWQCDQKAERAEELAPLAMKCDELEATLHTLYIDKERYSAAEKTIAGLKELIKSRQADVSTLEVELEGHDSLKCIAATADALLRECQELAQQIGEREGNKKAISKDLDDLLRGICPYTSEPCQSIETRGHKYEHDLHAIDEELNSLRATYQEKASLLKTAQQAANQVSELDQKRREQERTCAEIETHHQRIKEEQEPLEELGRKIEQIRPTEEQVKRLKPSAEEYNSLKHALEKSERATLADELNGIQSREAELQLAIKRAEEKITQLVEQGGDEAHLERLEKEQRELQSGYGEYMSAQGVALQLEAAIARCEGHVRDLQALEKKRLKLSADLESKTHRYNESEHQQSERAYLDLSQKLNELRGTSSQLEKQIEELRPRAAELAEKKDDLMVLDVERAELDADGKFFDEIRESFKNLSEMRPHYVRKTTQHAGRYWEQLANDLSQLHWQEDYLIFKAEGDDVISLYEMSGGEKISACLAMRLAMQEALGGLGLFILDEPTIHLDEERCDILAQQIGEIKGLNQIIVISHDDAFNAYTQQQITIKKGAEGQGSTVEC